MCACLKHFPGHGDTDTDSHSLLPTLPYDMERLERVELVPFRTGVEAGVKAIMTTHVIFSALDKDYPATLSRPVLTGLLRGRMNFGGIILSDAMAMHAIAHNYSFDEAVAAVQAGCDAIIPSQSRRTLEALQKGYRDGAISPRRVKDSVMRILRAKQALALPQPMPNPDNAEEIAGDPRHRALARRIAESSIACGGDPVELQRFRPDQADTVTLVTVANYDSHSEAVKGEVKPAPEWLCFEEALRKRFRIKDLYHVTPTARSQIDPGACDTIVVGMFVHNLPYQEAGGILPDEPKAVLERILKKGRKAVVLSFGNPYPLAQLNGLGQYLCAFSDAEVSIEAAVRTLAGEMPPRGALPSGLGGR